MHQLRHALRKHNRFFIVVTLLTLVMTFPAGFHVFDYSELWFPSTNLDVFMKVWDAWHGWQNVTSPSDFFFTNLLFYPQGVSLTFHNYSLPHMLVHGGLAQVMPVSNAYSLTYLLFIFAVAGSSYVYLYYLIGDKSVATLGAVIVAMSPFVINQEEQVEIQMMATIPLSLYFFHRGAVERRYRMLLVSALLVGATCLIGMYLFVILSLMFAMYCLYFAALRWRDKAYWIALGLCALIIGATSAPRIYPMLKSAQGLEEALSKMQGEEIAYDLVEYVYNTRNPITGPLLRTALDLEDVKTINHNFAFTGFTILILIAVGLLQMPYRRKMLPWLFLLAPFVLLRLGSTLTIGGQQFHGVLLPKHYLDELLPFLTKGFYITGIFHSGALLPLAVLACYGAQSILRSIDGRRRTAIIGLCIALVCFEYYSTLEPRIVAEKDLLHLRWLDKEPGEKRLINLPMRRQQSKWYGFLQTRSGYPQAEGLLARTPSSAYSYITANPVLNAWLRREPISCEFVDREWYVAAMAQLEADGFSHVVYHLGREYWYVIKDSFHDIEPAYEDESVRIYRLRDLRDSCTEEFSALYSFSRAYAHALQQLSILEEPHGVALVFPPSIRARNSFMRYLQQFADIDRTLVTITSHEPSKIEIQRSDYLEAISIGDLEKEAALWLVNSPQAFDAEQTPAFQDWFRQRFHYCRRAHEDAGAVVDLYLQVDIPCSAVDDSSALHIQYDGGVRLHNASFAVEGNMLLYYLAWTNASPTTYAFSLQFFDENGDRALQYDNVIHGQLLSTHEIDTALLPAGDYSIQLIVYDFETGESQGGAFMDSGQQFPRALGLGKIEV